MRNRFSQFLFVSGLVLAQGGIRAPLARAQTPAGASGATPQASTPTSAVPAPATVPKPTITGITPAAPLIAPNQPLTLTGADFQDKLTVTFTDSQENSYPANVLSVDSGHLVVTATLGLAGKWTVSAKNPGGPASDPFEFQVANSPAISRNSPAIWAFFLTAIIVTVLLGRLLRFMLKEVLKVQTSGQWSLGDALSEESAYQPAEIKQKSDVIIFGSTSRLIALIGLMGILSIVVGIGYSIMWSLYIYGTVPDLSQVRSFLYGSACLFAPYLANQLSGIFTPSAKKAPADNTPPTGITGIVPDAPAAAPGASSVRLTGSGFQAGLSLTFTDPQGGAHTVAGADITEVAPTLVSANVTLDTPGSWKVAVANPAAAPSGVFRFSVFGPPTITGADPAQLTHDPAARPLTFSGTGFMSGLSVQLTPPGGAAVAVTVTKVSSTSVAVNAILASDGDWQAVVVNPRNHASAAFTFHVN
jgi:hypothetical protein